MITFSCPLWRWVWDDSCVPSQFACLMCNEGASIWDGRSHQGYRLWPWTGKETAAYLGLQLVFSLISRCAESSQHRWHHQTGSPAWYVHQHSRAAERSSFSERPNLGHLGPSGSIAAPGVPATEMSFFLPDPSWASVNRGTFICDECCSVHRSLGRHVSQVRHLKHAPWPPTLLQVKSKDSPSM